MSQKVDSEQFDVIVIGAGPAGGEAARELAKLGRKVLVIERSQEIGEPNYSTAGTPKETIEEFSLPMELVAAEWDEILFATPRTKASWKFPQTAGYVFDFAKLRKFLTGDACDNGAEALIGTNVEELIERNGRFGGVRYNGALGSGEVLARVIIDASGHHEFSNGKLHINPEAKEMYATAMEYMMTSCPLELNRTLAFYVGSEYATRGYSWIFPMDGGKHAKVGTCTVGISANSDDLKQFQDKFIGNMKYFARMEPIEIHAGGANADGGVKHHVHKNIIIIGDAAHQINPAAGEGVRHAMKAGRLAAQVVHEWLSADKDLPALKETYEQRWREIFEPTWSFIAAAAKRYWLKFSDKQWDEFTETVRDLPPEDLYHAFFFYDKNALLKHPKIAFHLAKIQILD